MRRSARPALALLVLAAALAAVAARPTPPPAAAGRDVDAARRRTAEATAFNRAVGGELAAGRLTLAEAVALSAEANADRPEFLAGLRASTGGADARDGLARGLVYRVENPTHAAPAEHPALRAEYAALFGRPYTPPRP